jgi:hypothetical protein
MTFVAVVFVVFLIYGAFFMGGPTPWYAYVEVPIFSILLLAFGAWFDGTRQ